MMMGKIRMTIKEIRPSGLKNYYDVILCDDDGNSVAITIGEYEADNMVVCMEKLQGQRPMTYDVFVSILKSCEIEVQEVNITKFYDGIYYSKLILKHNALEFDIRPSDALNIALRCFCPVYVYDEVLKQTGFKIEHNHGCELTNEQCQKAIGEIENLSIFGVNMLTDLLKDAIEREDYVTASLLRDKIKNLNQNTDC